MKLQVCQVNGTPMVRLSEAVAIANELEAYKIANKNLQSMLDIVLQAGKEEAADVHIDTGLRGDI